MQFSFYQLINSMFNAEYVKMEQLPKKSGTLLKHAIFYNIAASIESMVPIILAPILTRAMEPEDYGIWIIFQSITVFLLPIIGLTFQNAIRMRFFELGRHDLPLYILTAFGITTFMAAAGIVVISSFSGPISLLTKFPSAWLWSTVFVAYLYALFYTSLSYFQFSALLNRFITLHIIQTTVTLALSVICVLRGSGWEGLVLSKIAGLTTAFLFAFTVLHLRFKGKITPSSRYIRELVKFGFQHLPSGQAVILVTLTDRLFLANFVSVSEAGLFAVGNLFAMVLLIAVEGFYTAWLPWMFGRMREEGDINKKKVRLALIGFYLLVPIGAATGTFMSLWLGPYIIGEKFQSGFSYIGPLMIAVTMQGFMIINMSFIHYTKKVAYMSLCGVISVAANIILDYILIPYYGGLGVAYGTIGAYGIAAVAAGILAFYFIKLKRKNVAGPVI